ncbi:bifunctional serine/threonine-protein kinase/ABC transporter substrate-binding protein [Microcoleus sp. ARI1-B5]|uniref:bifunctional serine/threonine-protein kinase/ABC transporter substrate-binding protein n=1 Tax=unclassified Microcoleus TaxID=2642155 RepID=UPI002FCF821D
MCLNPGDILRDRYQIIDTLGEGGFATTYTAQDALGSPENPLCVVVKEIGQPQSNDPRLLESARQQFEKEAKTLLHLKDKCPRIPALIESFEKNGNFYLIQEYIEGEPLSKELGDGKKLTEQQVINLLQDILEVLNCVHSQNIIHRDIKPSNLIRRKLDGKIAAIDFGAVKAIRSLAFESGNITQTRAVGTEGYMPAEQWKNQPRFNSDIYAAGIVGIQAIAGLDIADLCNHKPTCEIIWHYSTPDREIPQVSDDLRRILNKMVRYHFTDRYQSAAEVLEDLRAAKLSRRESLANRPDVCVTTADVPVKQTSGLSPGPRGGKLRVRLSIAVAIVAAGFAIATAIETIARKPHPAVLPDGLSAGDKILVTTSSPRLKQRGVDEFAASNSPQAFKQAFNLFKKSWQKEYGKDPETLIYMNNAFLEAIEADYYTIAIAVPIRRRNQDSSPILADQAKEVLRGVAQAQTQVNLALLNSSSNNDFPGQGFLQGKAINGKGLRVVIADDANSKSEGIQRANSLVKQPNILAVVGHTNSDMTMQVVDIYDKNNLVLMSPGTSTEELTEEPRKYFFRTPYTSSLIAKTLADSLLEKNQKKVAILYNQASPFGASFRQEFRKYFQDSRGGTIANIRDFDLSKKDFNAPRAIKEIQANGETAIALVPDAQVTSSLNSAIEVMKANRDRSWIAGAWTLVRQETLELASGQQAFEKVIFSVGWHPLSSPNKKFSQDARSLWGGEVNTRTAFAYDAVRAVVTALEMQPQPSREGMQKMLSSPDFSAEGATGTIQFNSPTNGDRKNPPSELVHIVKCPKEQFGLAFVPVKYSTASSAGLKCD